MRHQYQSKALATAQASLFDSFVSKNQNRLLTSAMTLTCMLLMTIPVFSQNVNVNPGAGSYPTLKDAFDAINLGTHTGIITVDIVGNTTETAPAVLNASGSGSASYTTIAIQPSGGAARTISGAIVAGSPLIDLNGADNVTIDGLNTGGNSLTISNTATSSSTSTSTIRFINDASNNIIQNATLQGSTTSSSSGVVLFSTGASTGNDGNNINNCTITAAGANLPINGIYSLGTSTAVDNSGNTLNQNNISDYFNAGLSSQGINLAVTGNSAWTITNNRLFQSALRLYTTSQIHSGLFIGTGSGYTITGNIIGFANSSGTGLTMMVGNSVPLSGTFPTAWNNTGTANATRYIAINCAFTVAGAVSNIQNNTIGGFALYTSSGAATTNGIWCAINVISGNVNIGTTTGNTIGSTTGQGSVYTAANTAGGAAVGIYVTSVNTVSIQNNTIGAIDAAGAVVATGCGGVTGIDVAGTGTFTISSNTIGNASANNLRAGNLATGSTLSNTGTFVTTSGVGAVVGIRSAATGATLNITGNTLRGFGMSSTANNILSAFTGITNVGAATSAVNITGNFLGTAAVGLLNYAFAIGASSALTGISSTASGAAATLAISSNDIQGITYSVAGANANTFITNSGTSLSQNISSNTFTNLVLNTTGSITFITNTSNVPATGTQTVNSNSIVTAFNKTGAGGTVSLFVSNATSVAGAVITQTNNNFSNITVTGATTIAGWSNTDGGTPTKNINSNTFNNWTGGTIGITGMTLNFFGGTSTASSNTITNITGQGAITGMTIGSSGAATSLAINGNTITNLTSSGTGGTVTGLSSASPATVVNISNNIVNTLSTTAATVVGLTSAGTTTNIFQNTINSLSSTNTSGVANGITITGGTTVGIYRNKIYDLSGNQAGTIVNGINVTTGTTLGIYNNLIGDLRAIAATGLNAINGINASATATYTVSFNTIYLNATSSSVSTFGNSCITFSSTATSLNSRNNILVNLSTPAQNGANVAANGMAACLRRSSGTGGTVPTNYTTTSNNNLYWANPTGGTNNHMTYVEGTSMITNPMNTFALFKAFLVNRDQLSVPENPTFLSTTGTSAMFLHIDPAIPTQIESGAVPIGGITDDYDGDVRSVTTPDIGADEGTFIFADLTGPSISYTPLGNSCNTSAVTLNASISDASGVPTVGIGLPVLYWKINAGAYTAATGVFVSGSTYQFTFGNGVVAADVVSYYIVAQDNAGTPNVSVFPAGGASGFSINPPAVSTPPTTPSAYTILTTLSGTYTVGPGGNYTTLTAAIADYNTKCISGAVIFNLTAATYSGSETFPIVINLNAASSAVNTLTIKPASAVAATITGTSGATASGLIKLNGAKYVIFDGLNTGGSSLTVENTSTTAGTTVFWLASNGAGLGATNNTIANCSIKAGVAQNASATSTYGIVIAGAALSGTPSSVTAGADNDNNTIQGNTITKVRYGIYTMGGATTNANLGTVISNNIIGPAAFGTDEIGKGGVTVREEDGIQITGNEIRFVGGDFANTSGGADRSGITFGTDAGWTPTSVFVKNASVAKNKIHDVVEERTFSATGIAIGAVDGSNATNNLYANNFIYNIKANGTTGDQTIGIGLNAANGDKVVFNTIYLTGDTDPTASASAPSVSNFGISIGSTSVTNPLIKDNIVYMDLTSSSAPTLKNTCINIPSSYAWGTGSSNYNNVYILPANAQSNIGCVGGSGGTFYLTLALWQAAVTQDANSINIAPVFTSGTDLHLVPASNSGINNLGNPVSGITTDIDGDTRNVTTPDMGADEFDGTPAAPMTYVSSTTTQNNISNVNTNTINQEVIGIQIVTSGSLSPLSVTSFTINTNGTTSAADIANAKLWYTGGSSAFATTTQVGATVALPSGSFPIATAQTLVSGTNYFWLTYDVPCTAMATNVIDAECNSLTVGAAQVPTVQAPAGSRTIVAGPLSGTKTVGSGGTYPTLTSAVAAVNSLGLGGNTTLSILNNLTEAGAVVINSWTECGGSNFTLTIKPAAATTPTISANVSTAVIKLNGADRVIIDGSNNGSSSRDMTITNTNTGTSSAVIWIGSASASNGATNNIIRNCKIIGNSGTTTVAGVISSSGTTIGNAAETANSNNSVLGCMITKAQNGLYLIGNGTTLDQNWMVMQNTIGATVTAEKGFRGIAIQNAQNFTISLDTIVGVNTASTSIASGILVGATISGGSVNKNIIRGVSNTNSGGWGSNGIYISSSSVAAGLIVYDNFISEIASYGFVGGDVDDNGYGIIVDAGAGYSIYHNTILMNTNQTLTSGLPAAFNVTSGVTTAGAINLRNNIFANKQTLGTQRYSIYSEAANTVFSAIDYNDYYTTGPNLGFIGSNRVDLAAIQAGFGGNTNSQNIQPFFVSATDLHIDPAAGALLEGLGTPAPISGVATDIDGMSWNSPTDMGADEFTVASCTGAVAGTASASPAGPFCISGSTTITAAGYSTGAGSTYLWQKSVDLAFTSPIDIGTASTVYSNLNTGTISSTTYYRLKVTCTSGMAIDYTLVPVTVTINPSVASVTGPSSKCQNDPAVMLSESGGTGTSWLWSTTETTQAITVNPSMTTIYSVTVTSPGGCTAVASKTLTVITAPSVPTVTPATPQSFCLGNGQALTAASTGGAPVAILSNDFNSTTPGTVTSGNLPAGWTGSSLTPGVRIWGVVATAQGGSTLGGGNFLYCESDTYTAFQTRSQVTTPAFDASNYSAVMIKFKQYYNDFSAGAASDSARVYISNDGGANFTQIQAYDTDQGTAFSGPGSVNASIPAGIALTSNMKVKLIYNSDAGGNDWYWAVDDFVVEGIPNPIYSWTSTPAIGSGLPGGAGTPSASNASLMATPTIEGVYTYTAVATGAGCASLPGTTASVTATSIEVANVNDSGAGSLRDIIACAGPGATITFAPALSGTTILLTGGEIVINKNLTLAGLGAVNLTVSGNNASRIFHVLAGNTLTLQGMTLKDATAVTDGGAVWAEGNLTLDNVVLQNNFENGTEKSLTVIGPAILQIIGSVDLKN